MGLRPAKDTTSRSVADDRSVVSCADARGTLKRLPIVQVIDRAGELATTFSGRYFVLALRE